MKFQRRYQPWSLRFEQRLALNVRRFRRVCRGGDGIFGVAEIAAGFLGNAIHAGVKGCLPVPTGIASGSGERRGTVGVIVKVCRHALLPECNPFVEKSLIIIEDANPHHSVDHAQFPVAIGAGSIFDHRLDHVPKHVLERLNV